VLHNLGILSALPPFSSFSRNFARALHDVIFCLPLRSVHDLFVYTDGSATSLGFCGAAASFFNFTCGEWSTSSTPVGIESSLTAELLALDLALSRLSAIVGGVVRFVVFSCFQTLRLPSVSRNAISNPLVTSLSFLVRTLLGFVEFSHCLSYGFQGQIALKAMSVCAAEVRGLFPGQPLIPLLFLALCADLPCIVRGKVLGPLFTVSC
jgi:hypothetical protein